MFKTLLTFVAAISIPTALSAQDRLSIKVSESFDDMAFAVENAILNHGLVIDSVSHVGDMLARTAEDVGAENDIYVNARTYNFCTAVLSREVMTIDPTNISYCPYSIYVFTTTKDPDVTVIGHQLFLYPEMAVVNDLLRDILLEAADY